MIATDCHSDRARRRLPNMEARCSPTRFFHPLPPFCSLAFSSVSNRDRNARYENCRFLLPTRESNPRESLVGSEEKGNAKSNSVPGFFEASLDPFPPAASSRLVGSRENGEMRSWISPFSRASLSRFLKKK